jgi:hypothetical protein
MDPLGIGTAILRHGKPVLHRDALDHEHAIVILDLADRLDLVALRIDFDLTRLQRAREGARQSAAGGGHNVVERRRVRRVLVRLDAIVLGDLRMHSEEHRLLLGRKVGEPLRPAQPLDSYA